MQIIETRDKNYTALINGVYLHSKYAPYREAEKFILTNIKKPSLIIVIGAGLGYLYKALYTLFPEVEVVGIPLNKKLGELSLDISRTPRIQWNGTINIDTFLTSVISEENIKGLQIIEWEPSSNQFPEESKVINSKIAAVVRKINGNILTTARFGRIWIKNSLKNYLRTESYITSFFIDRPIIIAAAGFSLNNNLSIIKEVRDKYFLISLSSAALALEENGIKPDLIISTDPGYYSKLHLYGKNYPLAMPLSNSTSADSVLLINQGTLFENEIISTDKIPSVSVGENGTVAGSALEMALENSNSPIFLIGQDLENRDIISHVRPYAFDNLLRSGESKLSPYYSTIYKRVTNSGISFKTYRDWFSRTAEKHPGRIYRVNSQTTEISGIKELTQEDFLHLSKNIPSPGKFTFNFIKSPSRKIKEDNVKKILNKWIYQLERDKIEENPLFYLISTPQYTDIKDKTIPTLEKTGIIKKCRDESVNYISGLLRLYGRKLL